MEQKKCEKSMQNVLNFKCKKILLAEEKSTSSPMNAHTEIVVNQDSVGNLASLTPVKTVQPLRTKNKGIAVEPSSKYKTITEFFDRMETSLRLLNLRKKLPTFQNICTQVEILTKKYLRDCRKFSYSHLAQIKHVLPEAVHIERILTHDEETLCMKPDMKVTLLLDVIDAHPDESAFMALRRVFRARLLHLISTYPEVKANKGYAPRDDNVSQTCISTHQKMHASLPDLFDLICRIFRSANCSSITKQELVHKIIANNCDIVERREAEEQLEVLEELIPDWIHQKLVPGGDILYSIKKVADLESIRAMLVEAV